MSTIQELFSTVLAGDPDCEDSDAWHAIRELWRIGTVEVFESAKALLSSADPHERATALDVMSLLGMGKPVSDRPYLDQCVGAAFAHLNDSNTAVVTSAAWALAHLPPEDCVSTLKGLKGHTAAAVRLAVATRLAELPDEEQLEILTELSRDEDDEVRNWATFGIGTAEVDGPEIRRALRDRVDDPYRETRQEAVWGLARRGDAAGIRLLLDNLERETWWTGDESAARDVLGLSREATVEQLRSGLRLLMAHNSGGDRQSGERA